LLVFQTNRIHFELFSRSPHFLQHYFVFFYRLIFFILFATILELFKEVATILTGGFPK